MGLTSKLFKGDPRLESCLVSDPSHVTPGTTGPFVGKIQFALTVMGLGVISADEIQAQRYGPSTTNAVLGYKTLRRIINPKYQSTPDNIVGKMTIQKLDAEMAEFERTHPDPPPEPVPPVPPAPVEPLSRRFAIRCATMTGNIPRVEPDESDPTTAFVDSAATFFQVFDIDNMPVIQFDEEHAASYFMEAPGLLQLHVGAHLFKRLPRLFRLQTPMRLSELGCRRTYRTLTFNGPRFESFLDLSLAEGVISVPMFLHMGATPVPNAGPVGVLQRGAFRFEKAGL